MLRLPAKSKLMVCGFAALLIAKPVFSQSYLWPTDASKLLTSAFCEYRGRRFHAGVDIKTWGRIGYKVFAVRPGYVWRISVSPYGYGKAVYLKLDTGEIALFAHLSKFSDKIQQVVEAEQNRLGRYRINKYLKPGEVPVAQGEIIAFTGQTGIGAPHLHFEIRDAGNRPVNPLSKGYVLPDNTYPIVTRVSFTPMDSRSEVNGDFQPLILFPARISSGKYLLKQTVTVWGRVGLAISCYDKGGNDLNRYGVYRLRLFVDDKLRFQYEYDKFSFQNNRYIELERDYRLLRRQLGRFYKLYKDKHNKLSNYLPNKPGAGLLRSATLSAIPELQRKEDHGEVDPNASATLENQIGGLLPGLHDIRIEVSDYFGNVTTVNGGVQVGSLFNIQPILSASDRGGYLLTDVLSDDLRKIEQIDLYRFQGKRWRPIAFDWAAHTNEKGGDTPGIEYDEPVKSASAIKFPIRASMLRIVAHDQFGTPSRPYIFARPGLGPTEAVPQVSIDYDYFDDYLRFDIKSSAVLKSLPRLVINSWSEDSIVVEIYQKALNEYVGKLDLNDLTGSVHQVTLTTEDLNGVKSTKIEKIVATKIRASEAKRVFSEDRNCRINFWLSSLYQPIFVRIAVDSVGAVSNPAMVGNIYEIEPRDVPLNSGAIVHLRYPASEVEPEKLGVYFQSRKGRWVFVDNKLNETNRTIWAKVLSFEKFALLRDEAPPEITHLLPANGSHLTNRTPRISFKIFDRLSGIRSEEDIVVQLDGNKLIAEYDPERRRVSYQVRSPLPRGRHRITVWAQDASKNVAQRSALFWIE
ncbi:MAG: M23 family metallopeptidase [bacterium]